MNHQTVTRRALLIASPAALAIAALPAAVLGAQYSDQSLRMKELAAAFAAAMSAHFGDQFDALIQPDGTFWLKGKHVSLDPDAAIEAAYANWSAAYEGLADNTDPMLDEWHYRNILACEQACVKLTPVTARGLALQFLVFTSFGEFEATKSANHDFEATMLRTAGVSPPRGLVEAESVQELLARLAVLPAEAA
jgi:hypothetical protein